MEQEDTRGHRQRLRQRFVEQGLDKFQDYEALELLLRLSRRGFQRPRTWPAMTLGFWHLT